MPKFSKQSMKNLVTCHVDLQKIFQEVVKDFDCTVICGYRNQESQNEAYSKGYSKVTYPNSKHNTLPSLAVDVTPYPINWNDTNRMRYFAGYVIGIAHGMNIHLRWGGDWNSNFELKDENFFDFAHFELRGLLI